jgi:hypothetical protein
LKLFDGAALGDQIVLQVREYVARSVGAFGEQIKGLGQRLETLEKREPVVGPQGPAGKDGESVQGPPGADGASVSLDDVQPLITVAVADAIKAMPMPKDGRDGKDAEFDLNEFVDTFCRGLSDDAANMTR